MDKRCKLNAGPTRTQRLANTEMTAEAASSRSSQGHTGACQDRKAPAALTGGRNGRDKYKYVFTIGEREKEREDRAEARERRNQGEGPISRPTPHRGAGATEKNKRRRKFSSEATSAQRRGGQGDQRPHRELGTRSAAWCDRGSSMRSRSGPPLPSGGRR